MARMRDGMRRVNVIRGGMIKVFGIASGYLIVIGRMIVVMGMRRERAACMQQSQNSWLRQ